LVAFRPLLLVPWNLLRESCGTSDHASNWRASKLEDLAPVIGEPRSFVTNTKHSTTHRNLKNVAQCTFRMSQCDGVVKPVPALIIYTSDGSRVDRTGPAAGGRDQRWLAGIRSRPASPTARTNPRGF
jgi:hypothetical protein